jgi:hypothetical protein
VTEAVIRLAVDTDFNEKGAAASGQIYMRMLVFLL